MKAKRPMDFNETFIRLMNNISPVLSVRPYKRSGTTIRVPFKVYPGYENFSGLQIMRNNAKRRLEYHAFVQYYLEAVDSFLRNSATTRQVNRLYTEAMGSRKFIRRVRRMR